ncbi:MAG: hypothetical protein HGB28_00300 [Oscillochloris sp.]|nr:hypothetical protein [Oscillochloris sp.]
MRIYTRDYALVATRAAQPGERLTHPDHLPPEKLPGATWTRAICQGLDAEVGSSTTVVVARLLDDGVIDRYQRVIRILKLRTRVGDARLEAACARALRFDDLTDTTLTRMLDQGLEQEPLAVPPPPPTAHTFLRSAGELLGHCLAVPHGTEPPPPPQAQATAALGDAVHAGRARAPCD